MDNSTTSCVVTSHNVLQMFESKSRPLFMICASIYLQFDISHTFNAWHTAQEKPVKITGAYVFAFFGSIRSYSSITSTKSPSFCTTTFSASLTSLTARPPQSHDCSCYVSRPIPAPPQLWLQKTHWSAHTTSRTLPSYDVSIGSLTLPMPEAGECRYN